MLNTKDILKNSEEQLLVTIDFYSRENNIVEVNGDHPLFNYQQSSK